MSGGISYFSSSVKFYFFLPVQKSFSQLCFFLIRKNFLVFFYLLLCLFLKERFMLYSKGVMMSIYLNLVI